MSFLSKLNYKLEDVKPLPLIPADTEAHAGIIEVKANDKISAVVIKVCLNNNEGVFHDDGETPIDGTHHEYNLWFPKPGDEEELTKNGKETKANWKMRQIFSALEKLNIPINDISELDEVIDNGELVGIDVRVKIGINEYNGNITNQIKSIWVEKEEAADGEIPF